MSTSPSKVASPPGRRTGALTATDIEKAVAYGRSVRKGHGKDANVLDCSAALLKRHGAVLDSRSILKVDHIPNSIPDLYPVRISGAFNLRQSPTTKIFGAGQSSITGYRGILNLLGAKRSKGGASDNMPKRGGSVYWINLREEPTVFVNGRSTVLRNRSEPFHNLVEFQGIKKKRIQDLERRLKEDIIDESRLHGGSVVVHEEKGRKEIEAAWESVDIDEVLTPEEVFFMFGMKGYRVVYERIPTTPEQAPSASFFDSLVECLMEAPPDATIVFNCQTGHGRSTMAMVAAGLVQFWRGIVTIPAKVKRNLFAEEESSSLVRNLSGHFVTQMNDQSLIGDSIENAAKDDVTRQLEAGFYQPVIKLIRIIENGRDAKKHVDFFCDDSGHLVNLRSIIMAPRGKASRERYGPAEQYKLMRAATSLRRYILLITFDCYMSSQVGLLLSGSEHNRGNSTREYQTFLPVSFESWLHGRPEIGRLLHEIETKPGKSLEAMTIDIIPASTISESGTQQEIREALASRHGSVLNTDTLLKADHFPGGILEHNSKNPSLIRGASNFRNIEGTPVHGVCTPSIDGIHSIVHYLQTGFNAKNICWTNLREEPVVYINKHPFVLRSVKQPFRNVSDFVAVDFKRLEAAEMRLKEDILAEAKRLGGRVLVHTESSNGTLELHWERVAEDDDVLTPKEAYGMLAEAGLPVNYARLPMTPEHPPAPSDVDEILKRVKSRHQDAGIHFVFNCQMGRGRTTIAMAVACMELEKREHVTDDFSDHIFFNYKPKNLTNRVSSRSFDLREVAYSEQSEGDDDSLSNANEGHSDHHSELEPGYDSDESPVKSISNVGISDSSDFGSILSLIRVLSNGLLSKTWANAVIDKCGYIENIRNNITTCIERSTTARTSERASNFIARGLLNLRRYFYLILVASYQLSSEEVDVGTFKLWFERRPEFKTIFSEIKDKASLQFVSDKVLSGPPPSEKNEITAGLEHEASEIDTFTSSFVAQRRGMVLTKGSILKSDHFPGCNRLKNIKLSFVGVPNFRPLSVKLENSNVKRDIGIYGTGIPTVAGLIQVLEYVASDNADTSTSPIVWINLREEPILYINGRPLVLRKLEHPFENLEHTGISKDRVEDMEERLKVDVINEIMENNGKFLLHEEDASGLQPIWESVDISEGSTAVQTPRDVYDMMGSKYDVVHKRVPITDEQAPKVRDCDEISNIVRNTPVDTKIIFNCQMGRGRTTTGLVIGVAVRLWKRKELYSFPKVLENLIVEDPPRFRTQVRSFRKGNPSKGVFLSGRYQVILSLIRLLEQGAEAKQITDSVIDFCDALQNLREAIVDLKFLSESDEKPALQRAGAKERGVEYVKRYYQLIEFVAYLLSLNPDDTITTVNLTSFARWLVERPELKTVLRRVSMN